MLTERQAIMTKVSQDFPTVPTTQNKIWDSKATTFHVATASQFYLYFDIKIVEEEREINKELDDKNKQEK
jgi:hypothetical protein